MARRSTKTIAAIAVLGISLPALAACGSDDKASGDSGSKVELSLVAYSTPQTAYEAIIKAFQATPAGKNITFKQSYGASGDQSRAVVSGLKADIVAFSLETDITRLVKATPQIVDPSWNSDQYKGIITDSVAAIGFRKGNPKGIKSWEDLTKPGVQVITPNPFTSGAARWNILGAYGAISAKGSDKTKGVDYLKSLFKNVPVQDDSGRKALATFTGGKGDALITYENEAIFAQQKNQPLDYIVPDSTILIENPIAVTKTSTHPAEAKAFLDYLHTVDAQKIYADNGYRPVVAGVPGADKFPKPAGLFTIKDLGGWDKVTKEFFDPAGSIVADIEKANGVSIEKK